MSFGWRRSIQVDELHHLHVENSGPGNLLIDNVIKPREDITRFNDLCQVVGNFVHQVKPDGPSKRVALFQVDAADGEVRHPAFWFMGDLLL